MTREVAVSGHIFPDTDLERQALAERDVEVRETNATTTEELIERASGADALLNMIPELDERVFAELESLEVVAQYSVGVEKIDVEAASDAGVLVSHVPDYCVEEVSTHAVAVMLACLREVPRYDRAIRDGHWSYKVGRPIHRIRDLTVGFAAFGRIPQRVREKLRGFGVDAIAYDPYVSESEIAAGDAEKVDFDGLVSRSDVVSVHTPLTEDTRGLFDAAAFEAMPDEAVVVNCGRGGVVDEAALASALEDGELGAAGLDVMAEEPPGDSPLVGRDDVVLTPHAAWYSEESMTELRTRAATAVVRALDGERPDGLVNPELFDA